MVIDREPVEQTTTISNWDVKFEDYIDSVGVLKGNLFSKAYFCGNHSQARFWMADLYFYLSLCFPGPKGILAPIHGGRGAGKHNCKPTSQSLKSGFPPRNFKPRYDLTDQMNLLFRNQVLTNPEILAISLMRWWFVQSPLILWRIKIQKYNSFLIYQTKEIIRKTAGIDAPFSRIFYFPPFLWFYERRWMIMHLGNTHRRLPCHMRTTKRKLTTADLEWTPLGQSFRWPLQLYLIFYRV